MSKIQVTSIFILVSILLSSHAKHASVDFDVSMEFEPNKNNYHFKMNRQPLEQAKDCMDFLRNLYKQNNVAIMSPRAEPYIPKIFHQIWLGPLKPPAIFKKSQESIKKYHPEWKYKLWTDKDIPQLKLFNQKYYDLSKNYGERADIVRYEILYKYGGVYIDVDFVCLKPFDILNHSYDFYTSLMPLDCEDILCNGIIASIPGHPILKDCIETIKDDWYLSDNLIVRVGPFHFQKSFWKIARQIEGKHIAFPKSFFFPINYSDKKECKLHPDMIQELIKPEAFAIHHWSHSWIKAIIN